MMKKIIELAKYIVKAKISNLSNEEQKTIDDWKNSQDERKDLYAKLKSDDFFRNKKEIHDKFDTIKGWGELNKRNEFKSNKNIIHYAKYAAVIIITISLSIIISQNISRKIATDTAHHIEAVSAKAFILLSNGKKINVDSLANSHKIKIGDFSIKKYDRKIVYNQQKNISYKNEYNTIIIPKGGDYQLTLSDGSQIWLNSDTKLRFPITFYENTRKVFLEGEAYFDVAHDENKPFVIITETSEIEVLGTSFNLSSYKEDNKFKISLVNGSVKTTLPTTEVVMKAGYELSFDKTTKTVTQKQINTDDVVLLKKGIYVFQGKNLLEVSKYIERWYNVKFHFKNKNIETTIFTGFVNKYEPIDSFINRFKEIMEYSIRIEGNNIYVK